jgi:putative glutamine amidotransferase
MNIAVTDTGKEDKQQAYLDWLRSFEPECALSVVAHDKNGSSGIDSVDGLVLTGGGDVDPAFYGGDRSNVLLKGVDRRRDEFEMSLLEKAFSRRIPILGICRGLQVVNVFCGGTLYVDLPSAGFQQHSPSQEIPDRRHVVDVVDGSFLREVTGVRSGVVNSFHHQGAGRVGVGLTVSSSSVDGVIESLERENVKGESLLLLVQWHPERMKDRQNPFALNIGRRFMDEIKKNQFINL